MITHYTIETLALIIGLIALWSIARKQEEQGSKIEVLEEKVKHPLQQVNVPTVWSYTEANQPEVTITSTDPSFKQKKKKEQIRLDEYPMLDIQLTPRQKVKKPIKKGK